MPYLPEAVESILNQDTNNFRYLIIDDCSTDNSYQYLKTIKDERIQLVRNKQNIGVSSSFNKALEIIETPILIRMDQDDISLPSRVREQTTTLYQDQTLGFLCSWENIIDHKGKIINSASNKINNFGELLAPILLGLCPIWHPSLACRVTALKSIGGFRDEYRRAEDYDVTARLALQRINACICQTYHLNVRRHRMQQSQQYLKEQKNMSKKIQNQSILFFNVNDMESEILTNLYRRDLKISDLLSNQRLLEITRIHMNFINSVHKQFDLNMQESKSFLRIFKKRLGNGFFILNNFQKMPLIFLSLIFLLTSPQYFASRAKKCLLKIPE